MLITHSLKATNPKSAIAGVIADTQPIQDYLTNVDAVGSSKLLWASPKNAADYKKAISLVYSNPKVIESFPDSLDTWQKQLYLKNESDEWFLHTPVTGCALLDAINAELQFKDKDAKNKHFTINHQPLPIARANHGEVITSNGALLRCIPMFSNYYQSKPVKIKHSIIIKGKVQGYNSNSGLISMGIPSLTAVLGLIDMLCLHTHIKPSFAFGTKNVNLNFSSIKGNNSERGIAKNKLTVPMLSYSEKKATCDFSLIIMLKNKKDYDYLKSKTSKIHKLAGGDIFDIEVVEETPENYRWVSEYKCYNKNKLKMVINDHIERKAFPMLTGFRLLEEPNVKKSIRDKNCKHAFSEPVFTRCTNTLNPFFWAYSSNDKDRVYTVKGVKHD